MNTKDTYDIAVVYSEDIAQSARYFGGIKNSHPFSHDTARSHYELSYSHLLDSCEKRGLRAIFTTSKDIIGPGSFSSGWQMYKGDWIPMRRSFSTSVIFDKFTPSNNAQRNKKKLLASEGNLDFFNHPEVSKLFHDKLSFYSVFSHIVIPTVSIEANNQSGIEDALERLAIEINHSKWQSDFGDSLVIKDRFGAGGNNIYKVDRNDIQQISSIVNNNQSNAFVIQPFVQFDKGLTFNNRSGYIDVRVLLLKEKIVQAYIRVASEGEFRCNEHQGADLEYIKISDIPEDIRTAVHSITPYIPGKKPLYALDFIRSNNGNVYLMEGNHSPGIDYNVKKRKNARKTRELIDIAVKEIVRRVELSKISVSISLNTSRPVPTVVTS